MDDPKPEVIEQEMAETRSSLVDKIAALEQQVVATVQSATTAVQDTVQSVTDAVHDTTHSVRESLIGVQDDAKQAIHGLSDTVAGAFDVATLVKKHPVPVVGAAAAAGFVVGLMVFGKATRSLPRQMVRGSEPAPQPSGALPPVYYAAPQPAAAAKPPSWMDELLSRVGQEAMKLGEQVLSKAVAQARASIEQTVPKLVDDLVHTGAERVGLHRG